MAASAIELVRQDLALGVDAPGREADREVLAAYRNALSLAVSLRERIERESRPSRVSKTTDVRDNYHGITLEISPAPCANKSVVRLDFTDGSGTMVYGDFAAAELVAAIHRAVGEAGS